MKRFSVAMACLLAVVTGLTLSSCAMLGTDSRMYLKSAVESYTVTLEALTEMRKAGQLSERDIVRIDAYRFRVRQALDLWRDALKNQNEDARVEAINLFIWGLEQLREFLIEEADTDGDTAPGGTGGG